MRVLQIVPSLKKNGTETAVMNVLRYIDKEKIQFDFLSFNNSKEGYYEEALALGAKVYYIPARKKNPFTFRKRLNAFFADHAGEFDAIQLNDMSLTSLSPLLAAKKNNIPQRIMFMHGSNCQGIHNKLFHRINRLFIKNAATRYLGCSESSLKWGYPEQILDNKAIVINNGIDLEKFRFDNELRHQIRLQYGIKENEKVLLHVGSFKKVKNHIFLLEIFKQASENNPDLKLMLVGDGPLMQDIQQHVAEYNLQSKVIFTGRQDNIPAFMSASDCMILPSLHEGLPMVVIEAQASGLPVIVSTGVSEESKASDNFTRLDLNENKCMWSNSINEMVNLKDNDRKISNKMNKFSIEKTVEMLEAIYLKK